jgi:hypothetical protein
MPERWVYWYGTTRAWLLNVMTDQVRCEKMLTLLDFENAILDLFEKNRITIQDFDSILVYTSQRSYY